MAEADPPAVKPFLGEVINVHQAKTHLSRLLDRAQAGEEIVLFKAGKPYAKLVPFDAKPRRQPGGLTGTLPPSFFDPLPDDEMIGLIER